LYCCTELCPEGVLLPLCYSWGKEEEEEEETGGLPVCPPVFLPASPTLMKKKGATPLKCSSAHSAHPLMKWSPGRLLKAGCRFRSWMVKLDRVVRS